jgi:hypothetical protein
VGMAVVAAISIIVHIQNTQIRWLYTKGATSATPFSLCRLDARFRWGEATDPI